MKKTLLWAVLGSLLNLSVCFAALVAPCWSNHGASDLARVSAIPGAGGCRWNDPSISPFAADCPPGGIASPMSVLATR